MQTPSYYVKTAAIVILMFGQSFFLTWLILNYVKRGDFFTLDSLFATSIIILMILIAWTFSLSVGSWDKYMKYLTVPVPVGMGVFTAITTTNLYYALAFMAGAVLLLCIDIQRSVKLSSLLIKFEPTIILKFSTSGLLFLFSIMAGVMVVTNVSKAESINVGREVSKLVGDSVDNAIKSQLKSATEGMSEEYLKQIDPAISGMLQQFGLPTNLNDPAFYDPANLGIDTKNMIEIQVNNFVEPYKYLVHPIIALIVFGMFQFYAAIATLIFMFTINGVYWIAKKTNFFKVDTVQVEKEVLKF